MRHNFERKMYLERGGGQSTPGPNSNHLEVEYQSLVRQFGLYDYSFS